MVEGALNVTLVCMSVHSYICTPKISFYSQTFDNINVTILEFCPFMYGYIEQFFISISVLYLALVCFKPNVMKLVHSVNAYYLIWQDNNISAIFILFWQNLTKLAAN